MSTRENKLLIDIYALANPVFFQDLCDSFRVSDRDFRKELSDTVLGYSAYEPFYGHQHAHRALEALYPGTSLPVKPVFHVVPVWSPDLDKGMMVPLGMEPAEDWQGASLFKSFSDLDASRDTPLIKLLKLLENRWLSRHDDCPLPLRWRTALTIKLLCPIHIDAIDGNSLQLPLIVSVLRALCTTWDTMEKAGEMILGNRPVFASGTLCSNRNSFGIVEYLVEKAQGFLREYGDGLPAVLLEEQKRELDKAGLLNQFGKIVKAGSIDELLGSGPFREALTRFAGPPHPTEIDSLLTVMARSSRAIRFNDVAGMASWLLSSTETKERPVYQFKLQRQTGLIYAHNGMLMEAKPEIVACRKLLSDHPDMFGLTDYCDFATAAGVMAVDSVDPQFVTPFLDELEPSLPMLPVDKRVAYWGTRCQLFRLQGKIDEAVEAGKEAVRLADLGRASDSGRDRNYLIHALFARVKQSNDPTQRQQDLDEAKRLLFEAENKWAPRDSDRARQSQLAFCLHYKAELARLDKKSFYPPYKPPWQGHWEHPWYFALLSSARNTANDPESRKNDVDKLVAAIGSPKNHESLFFMLSRVYSIYSAVLNGQPFAEPLAELRDWCERIRELGFQGWEKQLGSSIDALQNNQAGAVEQLCDAVPYH